MSEGAKIETIWSGRFTFSRSRLLTLSSFSWFTARRQTSGSDLPARSSGARQQRQQRRFGEVADVLLPQDREVARRRAGCEIRHVDEQQPVVAQRDLHAVEKVLEVDDVLQHLARDDEVELAGLGDRVVTQ